MLKVAKVLSVSALTLLLSLTSYTLCYIVAEKYFFDKFFNGKFTSYGYRVGPEFIMEEYGSRSRDITALESNKSNILGTFDDNLFTIAMIGDSYVWGVGLKNSQRFASLLENKLNKIRPTRIISLGFPGYNTQDYLEVYDKLKQQTVPDLTIFTLVGNDAFINTEKDYLGINSACISTHANIKPIYDIYQELYNKFGDNVDYSDPKTNEMITSAHENSWSNQVNRCSIEKISALLPTEKSIYFITDNYDHSNIAYDHYRNILETTQKYVISSELGKNIQKYNKYWRDDVHKNFQISDGEGHPNFIANKMYADILFTEIISNPKWNFH